MLSFSLLRLSGPILSNPTPMSDFRYHAYVHPILLDNAPSSMILALSSIRILVFFYPPQKNGGVYKNKNPMRSMHVNWQNPLCTALWVQIIYQIEFLFLGSQSRYKALYWDKS